MHPKSLKSSILFAKLMCLCARSYKLMAYFRLTGKLS